MQLFRPEALRGQDRLHGEVMLVRPLSWSLLGAFFGAAGLAAATFLVIAEHRISTPIDGRLVREGGTLVALFELPAGYGRAVEPGRSIRVAAVDYPHQSFGTVPGRIETVAPPGRTGAPSTVRATLQGDALRASGRLQPLVPGMAVRTRIETGSRSMASWLFGPADSPAAR